MNASQALAALDAAICQWDRDVRTLAQAISELIASENAGLLAGPTPARMQWTPRATLVSRELSTDFMARHTGALGAGATLAAEAFEPGTDLLPWWLSAVPAPVRLSQKMSPSTVRSYDHQHQPYFVQVRERADSALWGPYVDYLCADEYVMTLAAPLMIPAAPLGAHAEHNTHAAHTERRVGVAGFDLRVEDLESLLMPWLMRLPRNSALLSGAGRVLLANSGQFLVGERPSPGQHHLVEVGPPGLGLRLLSVSAS